MTPIYDIRPACVDDAEGIVTVTLSGFNISLHSYFIYGCPGASEFIRAQISLEQSDTVYTVAVDGARVVGSVELRRLQNGLVLNYISTLPEFRAKGLGRRLLATAIGHARLHDQERLWLDVFAHNSVASEWYLKLGFAEERRSQWWDLPLTEAEGRSWAIISGFPQARICQQAFGFAQLGVTTEKGHYSVGLLGERWIRLTQPEALSDGDLVGNLARLGPHRRILAILPDGSHSGQESPVVTSIRMVADLNALVNRLEQK